MKATDLGGLAKIRTGKLDANAAVEGGQYPFFTCAQEVSSIDSYSYDGEVVLVAGNGDLNVKYYEGKFDAYQRTYIVESKDKNLLNARYLYYFLSKYVDRLRQQSIGGVIKYIKLGYLTETMIPLPSIKEQNKIVEILDQAEDLKRKREETINKIEELKKSIFFDMFGDPLFDHKWDMVKLSKLISSGPQNGIYKPSTEYNNSGTPIIRIDSFYDGKISYDKKLKRVALSENELNKYKLDTNDILINRVNSIEYLGKSAIVEELSEPTVYESNIMRFSLNKIVNPQFLIANLQQRYVKKQILNRARNAVNQSSINQQDVKDIEVIVPPMSRQTSYVDKIRFLDDHFILFNKSLQEINLLNRSILQKAFNGELAFN